jgi:glycosyltransferase involved in cell wall biosynthesis
MSKRLLAINPVDHPGGAETTLLRALAGLAERGWEVELTTPGRGPLRDAAIEAGFGWRSLPLGGLARGEGARATASWPAVRRLARQADVVYLNGAVTGRLLPALIARREPAHAVVALHIHDMLRRIPRFWRRADVVIAASEAVARGLPGLDAHVIYPPVDADPPPALAPWPIDEGPVVGFVGRLRRSGRAPQEPES